MAGPDEIAEGAMHRAVAAIPDEPDQIQRFAHLIVRSAMALGDEGIGPSGDPVDTDEQTYTEAVALVRGEFADHELWDFGLIDDAEHTGDGCDRCATRQRNWGTRS